MSENKTKYLLKNVGILTIGNFSSKILVFLLVPIYTSVLSTEEYGSYDLIISTMTLLFPILSLNIVDAVMRFLMDKNIDKRQVVSIGSRFIIYEIAIFGIGLFLVYLTGIWNDVYGLRYYVLIYYILYSISQFLNQVARGIEKVKVIAVSGVISTIVTIVSNILFLLVLRWGLAGFFLASILAQFISVVYLTMSTRIWKYVVFGSIDKEMQTTMLIYSIPLIATVVGWWVNSASDKYVVAFLVGVSANGLLSVSYKIPQIINTLQGIFIQAWQISAIKEYGENDTALFYGNTFKSVNLLMCIACSGLMLLTKPLAYILYAKDFYLAWQYVPFLLISSVFNSASGMLGPILAAKKNSKAMMTSALIGAGANIVLNIGLIQLIGVQGATIATVICSYIIYVVRKRAVGKDISIENYNVVIVTWSMLCVQALIEIYLQNYIFEIVIMFLLLAINVKDVKNVLTSVSVLLKRRNDK